MAREWNCCCDAREWKGGEEMVGAGGEVRETGAVGGRR